jgi:dihydroxy-acid dehydratase
MEELRSHIVTQGVQRAPHRSLMKALGWTEEELAMPMIGIVDSTNEIIPVMWGFAESWTR